LIRKGRFDELFFVDLPSAAERKQVFSIQLTKRKRNPADYDLDRVAEAAQGFSGAEIESAVQTGLYVAFARKQELSNQDLLTALSSTVPLSITRAEEIADLRAWAKQRAVWASSSEARGEGA
jgi:SpoVK/Ycf46/Vps4 family AAA+-type ATPase